MSQTSHFSKIEFGCYDNLLFRPLFVGPESGSSSRTFNPFIYIRIKDHLKTLIDLVKTLTDLVKTLTDLV